MDAVKKRIIRKSAFLFLMLMRYSELMGYKRSIDFGRSDDYSDYYDVDYEHWEAICWAATWNILHPKGDPNASKDKQRIDPYGRVSRTEFNTILRDMLDENGVSTAIPNVPNPSQDKWVQKDGKYYVFGEDGIGGDVAIEASLSDNGKYLVSYTLGGNKDTAVQRKKDFIKAVKEYYK